MTGVPSNEDSVSRVPGTTGYLPPTGPCEGIKPSGRPGKATGMGTVWSGIAEGGGCIDPGGGTTISVAGIRSYTAG